MYIYVYIYNGIYIHEIHDKKTLSELQSDARTAEEWRACVQVFPKALINSQAHLIA